MKLKLIALAALAAGIAGCGEDISKQPEYQELIGKVYATKIALIVRRDDVMEISLDVPGKGGAPSLEEIPSLMREGKAPALLPAGSRFMVEDVYSDWSTTSGSQIRYTLRMQTPDEYHNFRLSFVGLIDYNRYPRRFKADLIEEVPAP